MSKAGKLLNAQAQAERALKRVERAQEIFARDYAAFPLVLRSGLRNFARARAGLMIMIATVEREIAVQRQKRK